MQNHHEVADLSNDSFPGQQGLPRPMSLALEQQLPPQDPRNLTSRPSSATTPPLPPLTNHEIYELVQKCKPQAATQLQVAQDLESPGGQFTARPKRTKNMPYLARPASQLERQDSVIVGTPGFRERYGKCRYDSRNLFLGLARTFVFVFLRLVEERQQNAVFQ